MWCNVCLFVFVCVHVFLMCVYVGVCVPMFVYVCICLCASICVYLSLSTSIYVYESIHVCVCLSTSRNACDNVLLASTRTCCGGYMQGSFLKGHPPGVRWQHSKIELERFCQLPNHSQRVACKSNFRRNARTKGDRRRCFSPVLWCVKCWPRGN